MPGNQWQESPSLCHRERWTEKCRPSPLCQHVKHSPKEARDFFACLNGYSESLVRPHWSKNIGATLKPHRDMMGAEEG